MTHKVLLVTDTHFGCRNDLAIFHDYIGRFYNEVFFPYLENNGINTIVHLGDIFDRRKYINFESLERCREYFFEQLEKRNLNLHLIIGNHDTFFRDTNRVNSPRLLLQEYDRIKIYEGPTTVQLGNTEVMFIPWICSENEKQTYKMIKKTTAQVAFGHLELAGFEMYKGAVIDHGMDAKVFKKFDLVCTGHFHHKSSKDNIHYLGSPYEIVWSDYDDPRGFHTFDTDTRQLEYIENPLKIFHKIHYDDTRYPDHYKFDLVCDQSDPATFKDCFVKVIVDKKNNAYAFDLFINQLEKAGVSDLQVVEDAIEVELQTDEQIAENADDTLSIIKQVVDELGIPKKQKKSVNELMVDLYRLAT